MDEQDGNTTEKNFNVQKDWTKNVYVLYNLLKQRKKNTGHSVSK